MTTDLSFGSSDANCSADCSPRLREWRLPARALSLRPSCRYGPESRMPHSGGVRHSWRVAATIRLRASSLVWVRRDGPHRRSSRTIGCRIRARVTQARAHVMQEQVAVQSLDIAHLGPVARRAADRREEICVRPRSVPFHSCRQAPLRAGAGRLATNAVRASHSRADRSRPGPRILVAGDWVWRLVMAGHFQPELDGARGQDKILEAGHLSLPAEASDSSRRGGG